MKSITVHNEDGTTIHYANMCSFCENNNVSISSLSSLLKRKNNDPSLRTKVLQNIKFTVHENGHDDMTYEFGKYEPLNYNRMITCECGVTHYFRDRKRHESSKFHKSWADAQN